MLKKYANPLIIIIALALFIWAKWMWGGFRTPFMVSISIVSVFILAPLNLYRIFSDKKKRGLSDDEYALYSAKGASGLFKQAVLTKTIGWFFVGMVIFFMALIVLISKPDHRLALLLSTGLVIGIPCLSFGIWSIWLGSKTMRIAKKALEKT